MTKIVNSLLRQPGPWSKILRPRCNFLSAVSRSVHGQKVDGPGAASASSNVSSNGACERVGRSRPLRHGVSFSRVHFGIVDVVPSRLGLRLFATDASKKKSKKPRAPTNDSGSEAEDIVIDPKRVHAPIQLPPAPSDKAVIKYLFGYMWPENEPAHKMRVLGGCASIILGKLCTIQAPLYLGMFVDQLSKCAADPMMFPFWTVLAYSGARLGSSFFAEYRSYLFTPVSQNATRQISTAAAKHLHQLDLNFLISSKAGDLQTIISRGNMAISRVLQMMVFNFVPTVFEFSLVLGVLAWKAGPEIAAVTGVTMAAYSAFTTIVSQHRAGFRRAQNKAEQMAASRLLDSLTNAEQVRCFGNEKLERDRYDAAQADVEINNVRILHSLAGLNFGQQVIMNVGIGSVLFVTAGKVLSGTMSVGDAVTIHALLFQLSGPLNMLGTVYRDTVLHLVDLSKIYSLLHMKPPDPTDIVVTNPYEFNGGHIRFENVCFQHGPERSLLKNISFDVPVGKKTAIVGPSGCGKSTLLKLLFRVIHPTDGKILIDGENLVEIEDLPGYRSHLGLVPQDMSLFNDTLGYNIRYGKPGATEEEMIEAATSAQINDRITEFPKGYGTPAGERGLKLSGGERQRIGMARCLLKNPPIVMFDEATSSLDTVTEQRILQALKTLEQGRTSLVVAHRLSTIADSDNIIVLGPPGHEGIYESG